MSELTPRVTDPLDRWASEKPDAEAMRSGDRSWTWAELHRRARQLGSALRGAGVAAGDRVAFLDKNNPACLETTLACSLLGAANAVVNYRLAPAEVAYIVNDAQAKILFVGAEFVPVIHGIRDQLAIERVIVVG